MTKVSEEEAIISSVWLKGGRCRWIKKAGLGIGKKCKTRNENDKTFLLVHSPFFISHSFRFFNLILSQQSPQIPPW